MPRIDRMFHLSVGPMVALLAVLSIGIGASRGDDDRVVFSGPQIQEKLPSLTVELAYDKHQGETVDFIEQAKGGPTLLVIVNGANRPAARLTRALMNYAEMQDEKLFAGVVYLDGDRSAAAQYLRQAISWWGVGPPVGISIDGAEGPGSYGLNRNVNLTVLVANANRVTANFALVQPSETDAPKILAKVVDLVGGRVPTHSEVLFMTVPTRKPANAAWRSAPVDVRLRKLICATLAAKEEKQARRAADAVEQFVGESKERQADLGNAAAFLLEGRTRIRSTPAVKHLRRWREQFDPRRKR